MIDFASIGVHVVLASYWFRWEGSLIYQRLCIFSLVQSTTNNYFSKLEVSNCQYLTASESSLGHLIIRAHTCGRVLPIAFGICWRWVVSKSLLFQCIWCFSSDALCLVQNWWSSFGYWWFFDTRAVSLYTLSEEQPFLRRKAFQNRCCRTGKLFLRAPGHIKGFLYRLMGQLLILMTDPSAGPAGCVPIPSASTRPEFN